MATSVGDAPVPRYTRYSRIPLGSAVADQFTRIDVSESGAADTPVGAAGGVVSATAALVVADADADAADAFGGVAASTAMTV